MSNPSNKHGLAERMKEYEQASKTYLPRRLPVIIRIDGNAFHTFTKGLKKPFDDLVLDSMVGATKACCKHIPGCKLAYTQSDEISLLVVNYENLDTAAWFDNAVQKLVSVSASIATMAFNKTFKDDAIAWLDNYAEAWNTGPADEKYAERIIGKMDAALFDARAFVLPQEEVANYFIWRQQDAIRNSIQAVAQAHFSQKQLSGKNCSEVKDMLQAEKGVDWDALPTHQKLGSAVTKQQIEDIIGTVRHEWIRDWEVPLFTENRDYIERFVFLEKESV